MNGINEHELCKDPLCSPLLRRLNTTDQIKNCVFKLHGNRSALFWDFTHLRVVIPYRLFGTDYRSHLQGSGYRRVVSEFCLLRCYAALTSSKATTLYSCTYCWRKKRSCVSHVNRCTCIMTALQSLVGYLWFGKTNLIPKINS